MSPMVIEFLNVNMLRNQLVIDYFSGSSCFTQKKQDLLEEWCIVSVSDLFSLNSIAEPEGVTPYFSVDRHLLYIHTFSEMLHNSFVIMVLYKCIVWTDGILFDRIFFIELKLYMCHVCGVY